MQQSTIPDYSTQQLKTQKIQQILQPQKPSLSQSLISQSQPITIHYTLCKKQATTISILSNLRLLIYNEPQQTLYYINYDQKIKCPFRHIQNVPKPKKDFVRIRRCIFKRDVKDGTTIVVSFNTSKKKGELECLEWRFGMISQSLAALWERFILEQKRMIGLRGSQIDSEESVIRDITTPRAYYAIVNNPKSEQQSPSKEPKEPKDSSILNQNQLPLKPQNLKQSQQPPPKKQPHLPPQKQPQNNHKPSQKTVDWNLKLLQKPNPTTIKQFQNYTLNQFNSDIIPQFIQQIINKCTKHSLKIVKQNIVMYYTLSNSQAAQCFRQEFQNFCYIVRCMWSQGQGLGQGQGQGLEGGKGIGVWVPLVCFIQLKGVVCYVKARFPDQAKIVDADRLQDKNPFMSTIRGLFKQLESRTKIHITTLTKSSIILNLSQQYQLNNGLPRLYLDQITSLLPTYPKQPDPKQIYSMTQYSQNQLVLGQLILDNFRIPVDCRQEHCLKEVYYYVQIGVKEIVEVFVKEERVVYGVGDLLGLMRFYGLKLSFLPVIAYHLNLHTKPTTLKHLKTLINTLLLSTLLSKNHLTPTITTLLHENQTNLIQQTIESILRKLVETDTVLSQHFWKELMLDFRREYGFSYYGDGPGEMGRIIGCVLWVGGVDWEVDFGRFRKIRDGEYRVQSGFVVDVGVCCESYEMSHPLQRTVMQLCTDITIDNIQKLAKTKILTQYHKYDEIFTKNNKNKFLHYLSQYISPFQQKYPQLHTIIYSDIMKGPPEHYSYLITLNYLKHHIFRLANSKRDYQYEKKLGEYRDFVGRMQVYFDIWFGNGNFYLCQLLELQANFYYHVENDIHSCKNIYLKIIDICKKNCGIRSRVLGQKLRQLGSIMFKSGYLKQSERYLIQGLDILEEKNIGQIQYVQLLGQLGQLYVALGDNIKGTNFAEKTIKIIQKALITKHPPTLLTTKNPIYLKLLYKNHKTLLKIHKMQDNPQKIFSELLAIDNLLRDEQQWTIFQQMVRTCVRGVIQREQSIAGGFDKIKILEELVIMVTDESNRKQSRQYDQNMAKKELIRITGNSSLPKCLSEGIDNINVISSQIKRSKERNQTLPYQSTQFIRLLRTLVVCTGKKFLLELF